VSTRQQARPAGLTKAQIECRPRSGAFRPAACKAVALRPVPVGITQSAHALTLTWPDAVLRGLSALKFWLGAAPLPASDAVHAAVPHGRPGQFRLAARRVDVADGT
jgi:hypothetical protein